MEVKGKDPSLDAEAQVEKAQAEEKGEISSKQPFEVPAKEDKVLLSPKAKQIAEAKRLLHAAPEIREQR